MSKSNVSEQLKEITEALKNIQTTQKTILEILNKKVEKVEKPTTKAKSDGALTKQLHSLAVKDFETWNRCKELIEELDNTGTAGPILESLDTSLSPLKQRPKPWALVKHAKNADLLAAITEFLTSSTENKPPVNVPKTNPKVAVKPTAKPKSKVVKPVEPVQTEEEDDEDDQDLEDIRD